LIQDAAKVITYKFLKAYNIMGYNETGRVPDHICLDTTKSTIPSSSSYSDFSQAVKTNLESSQDFMDFESGVRTFSPQGSPDQNGKGARGTNSKDKASNSTSVFFKETTEKASSISSSVFSVFSSDQVKKSGKHV
jgi:hypothetical protein